MQIEYINGYLLQTDVQHIIHGCNSLGVMGSGVALAIRKKYPKAFRDYSDCYNSAGLHLGQIIVSAQDDGKVIYNAITQKNFGSDKSKVYVSYWAIAEVFRQIESWGVGKIAMPKIGAGRAHGDWNVISAIIENTLVKTQPYVYVME